MIEMVGGMKQSQTDLQGAKGRSWVCVCVCDHIECIITYITHSSIFVDCEQVKK